MRARLLLSLSFFASLCCAGQEASLFHFDVKNGLVDNYVTSIAQDDRGFMWFGTAEGISRFDGRNFKNYLARRNRNSLSSNDIQQVIPLPNGHIGIITNWKVEILETALERFYQPKDFEKKMVRTIQKLNAHHYLVSSDTCYITDENLKILIALVPSSEHLTELEAYPLDRNLVLIANHQRFFIYDILSENFREIPFLTKVPIDALAYTCYDSIQRSIYFSHFDSGLYRLSIEGNSVEHWPIKQVEFVKQVGNYEFLVGRKIESRGSLYLLDVRTDSLKSLDIEKNNFDALATFLDKEGSQWIGTSQGITRRKPWKKYIKNWTTFAAQSTLEPPGKILKGPDNGIYLTFRRQKHLYRYNRSKDDWDLIVDNLGIGVWSTSVQDNEIIITADPSVYVSYVPATGKHYFPDFSLKKYFSKSDLVTLGFQHSNGDRWFSANRGGGLIRIGAKDKVVHQYTSYAGVNGRSFSYFLNCAEDAKGDLWFCVNKRTQLAHWDKKEDALNEISLDTVQGTKNMKTRGIQVVTVDKKNHVWVGFDGSGLVKYDPIQNTANQYTFENGLASAFISSMTFDKKGRLWIGTPKGLSYLNPEEEHIQSFTKADGLFDDRFTEACIFYDSTENTLWIGSASAVTRFNPDSLVNERNPAITLLIDEVMINGKTSFFNNALNVLSYNQNNLLFRFTAIDFDERDIQFNYRLSNHDKNWVDNLNNTSASYANLDPGGYSFNVRARHKGDNRWTELKVPFNFTIQTVWYKTILFRLFVASLLASGIFLLVRLYYLRKIDRQRLVLEKQQAIETERTRIATDMHDDFGATLSRIKFISEKIKLKPQENEDLHRDLSKISAFSDQMSEKMNEIVWALNERYDTLEDLISFSRAYAADYCAQHGLELNFFANNISNVDVNAEVRRNVFLVLKETLHNVAKHANAQNVTIRFEQLKYLCISLSDDGNGINFEKIRPFSNGLKNMKMRMEGIQGTFEILNGPGTTIKMTVPIKK
jgi:signal transduction histidine kinase/ligand-binding sensor domain-containing protein